MPKSKTRLLINLNLLKPQGNPEKIFIKLFKWLLSFGRYIFVFVEAIVLIAFGARFKLDADLQAKKEAIEEQIPYIESLKPYEILIRNTQFKITTITNVKKDSPNYASIFEKIATQIPTTVKVNAINMTKDVGNVSIHIIGETEVNNDLANFLAGLKEDKTFSNVNLSNIVLEQGMIKFTVDASTSIASGKNL